MLLDEAEAFIERCYSHRRLARAVPSQQCFDIPQTAVTLWIPPVAGTLTGMNPRLDRFNNWTAIGLLGFFTDIAQRVPKAVADQHTVTVRLFLIYTLTNFGQAEYLRSSAGKIDDRTIRLATEIILRIVHCPQTH